MTTKTVKRAYKYRFYPTEQQEQLLRRTFGCVRVVYNKALEERTVAWHQHGKSVNYAQSSAMLTSWKKTEDYHWLNEVSSVPLQQALRHLQTGFSNFWNKRSGYPRFKKRHARQSASFTQYAFRWNPERRALVLAKMTEPLDIHWSRDLPEEAIPSTVTVSLDTAGRWFVSLLVEETVQQLEPADRSVGIDLGAKDLAVLSTGEKIAPARMTRTERFLLRRAQKAVNRRVKGSNNREKAKREVARIHARVVDRRRDQLHQLSTRLVRENQTIVIEDLAVKPMMAAGRGRSKTGLNRAIAQASMAELRSMLEYKADWYGRELVVIDQWFPSTQLCSSCSAQTGPRGFSALGARSWTCSACGTAHDRDINAANNILAAGLAASVCGDGRSLVHV